MLLNIFLWILFGLIAGAIARYLMPDKVPGGIAVTILLGIVGALVGGFVAHLLNLGGSADFSLYGLLLAVAGGVLVLFVFGLISKGRM